MSQYTVYTPRLRQLNVREKHYIVLLTSHLFDIFQFNVMFLLLDIIVKNPSEKCELIVYTSKSWLNCLTKALQAEYTENRGEVCRAERELRFITAPRFLNITFSREPLLKLTSPLTKIV